MKEYIEERAVAIANYIIDCNATVRQTAKKFGISKSTVHKDVTDRLEHINPSLAAKARIVLDINKSERHIRGGMATKEKYQHRLQVQPGFGSLIGLEIFPSKRSGVPISPRLTFFTTFDLLFHLYFSISPGARFPGP